MCVCVVEGSVCVGGLGRGSPSAKDRKFGGRSVCVGGGSERARETEDSRGALDERFDGDWAEASA